MGASMGARGMLKIAPARCAVLGRSAPTENRIKIASKSHSKLFFFVVVVVLVVVVVVLLLFFFLAPSPM